MRSSGGPGNALDDPVDVSLHPTLGNSLVPQAADAEVGLLGKEEDAALAVNGALHHASPRRPELTDNTSNGSLTNTAEEESVNVA